ncbi:small ribosomal subunit Rsm22 family protein [Halobaculum magnesiiphilum]|uniref:Class I SAM-dependent methyltransferase n=1 Tax=Halobaculum magnesiiphilum TaxID=1017351 RepID=A0A8T8WE75_9EURY|nr:class I SAM-dependent methyltransferase [Halobaculum magnesiiphilum]QZP38141.1 class I SAM-dependent methyltransferase [Halobaculum magnesiiphilum]
MSVDREALRDTAKYLRNARPVDPEEVYEYLPDRPHPAVVRTALREEAFDLGLYEREDGTFVPANDDPVDPPGWSPEAFPDEHAEAIEDLLFERYGLDWHEGDSGDALRETIDRLKEDYYRGRPVEYDADAALAYAVYHQPDFYAAVGYVLDRLADRGLLPRTLRVLDVGAGTGGPALGLFDYLPDDALVDYHAIEPSANADVLEEVLADTRPNVHTTVHRESAEAFDPNVVGEMDLVLFGNVLSELDDPAAVASRYLDALAADGSCVMLAPADLNTSTELRRVERALTPPEGDVSVYAPDLRLWPGDAPEDRGWSFEERPDLATPGFQRTLDDAAARAYDEEPGTYVNTDVKFSWAILRPDGERRHPVVASAERYHRLADSEEHVTDRVNLLAVKLSGDLTDDADANPLFKVGDGSERLEHYLVLTGESSLNRDLREAPYGAILSVENVLILWNDDEGAYNLVCGKETVVDIVAA